MFLQNIFRCWTSHLRDGVGGTDWFVPFSSLSCVSLLGFPVHKGQEDEEEGGCTED